VGAVGGINNDNRVTILAANRNEGANDRCRFLNAFWSWTTVNGFTIDGFHFQGTLKDAFGYPATNCKAFELKAGCKNITIRNCTFDGFDRTSSASGNDNNVNIKIEWCEYTGIGRDCFSSFTDGAKGIYFYNNYAHDQDIDPARATAGDRHPDTFSVQGNRNVDIECLRNLFLLPAGTYCQGVFVSNPKAVAGGGTALNNTGVTIADNTILSHHTNNLFCTGSFDVLIERNQCRYILGAAGPNTSIPGITRGAVMTGFIRNNIMARNLANANNATSDFTGLTETNNTVNATRIDEATAIALHNFPVGPYGYEG
jgi:hypothetical protein